MRKSQLSSSVFLLLLTLSFSVSWASLSSILDATIGSSDDVVGCLLSNSNNITLTSQLIFTPVNASFQAVWEVAIMDTRLLTPSTPKPAVIVTPTEETLVQTTLYCTKQYGYELRIRSGGHDFEGISYTSSVPFVMLDFTNMRAIDGPDLKIFTRKLCNHKLNDVVKSVVKIQRDFRFTVGMLEVEAFNLDFGFPNLKILETVILEFEMFLF
ncbi:hypothetical protein L2E82_02402 [Cichorium intybus]|uniref:Uncharacterized protein n=1 Tax=Cichorium intybus TaxID=13427 RepID=A0ACB9H226_CICIN|nr:hypothetical protein L2E82_02402 [Cichorium intybus]